MCGEVGGGLQVQVLSSVFGTHAVEGVPDSGECLACVNLEPKASGMRNFGHIPHDLIKDVGHFTFER